MDKLDQLVAHLFQYYYQALVHILPMDDPNFIQVLLEHGLLNDGVKHEIYSMITVSDKASIFLEHLKRPGINYIKFKKLLLAMKETSYDQVVDLAYELQLKHIILRKNAENVQSK